MKRRAFFAWVAGLAGGLVDGFHGRQWRITRYDREARAVEFEEVNAALKRAYPTSVFLEFVEKESPFRSRLRGGR